MLVYHLQEYFYDPEVLTEGEVAPNDRCCRICGKIGHFVKDCPIRKKYYPCGLLYLYVSGFSHIISLLIYYHC